ncbi:SAM-dependent DNA methyltransferase [Staphylococcus pettenkoferi]|uniref:SAM-dependent DNA methyltransferase n=1 Tax=Staphylococcus pettenkoferi TaxID=170573 RepID=UPI002553F881|nr:SAM-dependent DNA methyltransferase [Staphylococcus pettenkoferi]MDK7284481.1 SAM-dependent DNA methyltransferase [Staphylococcus pettenkoferi]
MNQNLTKKINSLLNIKDSSQAPRKIWEILYSDKEQRDNYFKKFLEAFDKDLSYDWFSEYFQEKTASRNKHKYDYTPDKINELVNRIVGNGHTLYYEPLAGTGGTVINRWYQDQMQHTIFDYKPSMYFYNTEEIADGNIPILLFNMLIRGMNGVVVQCDVLTREAYGVFYIQNDENDALGFSTLNRLEYTERIEQEFNIKFVEHKYSKIKQTKEIPQWLIKDLQNANKEK